MAWHEATLKKLHLELWRFEASLRRKSAKNGCIIIQNKYGGNGNFYFEWDRSNGLNSSNLQLGTGSVSEEIYNQYDIGDTYCIEELML